MSWFVRGCLWKACLVILLSRSVQAVPSVDVEVRAAFASPPYLLELLETAAEENKTSYYPLLDRIADGYFDAYTTHVDLYTNFRKLLKEEGYLEKEEALSSFDLALSLHAAAPRIEAHFQYYNTTIAPSLQGEDVDCGTWIHAAFSQQRYCKPSLDIEDAQTLSSLGNTINLLPFDRVLNSAHNEQPTILYTDLTSTTFRQFHRLLRKSAQDGKTSYRVRYRPTSNTAAAPLTVSGYGVELALKRTDYIVIDDRVDTEQSVVETILKDEDVSDLRPLSSTEVRSLDMKAASFVLASDQPLDTLLRLTQDFPKHSSAIAASNVSTDFAKEHARNREVILPQGYNIMWINGVQIMPRDVDAYALLEHLRHERKLIDNVQRLGLSGPQAIELLTHEAITNAQVGEDVQRYDWRDDTEGGNVIIWLNNLEKDKRYTDWSSSISALLQRTYPGQLPPVAREVHNLIIPVDFANYNEVLELVDTIQNFVKRKVPIRFGLVPVVKTGASIDQAKMVYHLSSSYGLAAVLEYLELSIRTLGRKHKEPDKKIVSAITNERQLKKGQVALTQAEVKSNPDLESRIQAVHAYFNRLAPSSTAPILVNGVPVERTDEWVQYMSQRVSLDARLVQQYVHEQSWTDDTYIPDMFLEKAALRRNTRVVPEDDKSVRHINVGDLPFQDLPSLLASADTVESELVHMTIITDFDAQEGLLVLLRAIQMHLDHDNIELAFLHVSGGAGDSMRGLISGRACSTVSSCNAKDFTTGIARLVSSVREHDVAQMDLNSPTFFVLHESFLVDNPSSTEIAQSKQYWAQFEDILQASGIKPGQTSILLNGRVVGPFDEAMLETDDFESLYAYERKKRLLPATQVIKSMGLVEKAATPLAYATISNLIALSLVSDIPEGMFDAPPTVRSSVSRKWQDTHTSFSVGDEKTAAIQVIASIDPASETAQRWTPIIKVLSQLTGVYIKVFLNPRDRLEELPVKRFYRYVLEAKPSFASDGSVQHLSARFEGLPAEALLNIGMDIPPAWLLAPKDSVHDLDNIKLSAVKSGDVTAVYELEHILIEGHSRDLTLGPPPRGAQLVLATERDPHFADTIIMANLGYFQFKTNPGVYNLKLQAGRSQEIFTIESAGSKGYSPQPGDESTQIALMSFRGSTLFPRLARKPNMEDEDVLEASKTTVENLADQAGKALAGAGVAGAQAGKYLSKVAQFSSKLISKASSSTKTEQAEINIFSVASGHLYERMLNIMMVSVMKHTKHTVKFWFIEQFLSPSFKEFLPSLAQEYGFKYEMVTYKWPHWLRGQKEKQREIWGYKILFLDVLFPLDLDKVIFVDADQIVRTDMYDLVQHDLQGAPYGFTPMCDSRTEMEGFRFWKQGYWKNYLRGLPYHISALYVVDLKRFRQIAAGDRLRQQYHTLSADPNSLSNLDQDLPNHMQMVLPIHSLPQDWLWCETWCSDEALKTAKTIDLCNNPQTKEPKLDRARRQVPEWTIYDDEIAAVARRHKNSNASTSSMPGAEVHDDESIQEQLQREDAEKEKRVKDEL